MDKKTIMGTDYARLSLKIQSLLRSVIANLPTDIQSHILESKAMFKSSDLCSNISRYLLQLLFLILLIQMMLVIFFNKLIEIGRAHV